MRSLQLQAALDEFVAQAASSLNAELLAGQEVPFELARQSARKRGGPALYSYRPLTGTFIAEHFPKLCQLHSYTAAAQLLDSFDGLERYLNLVASKRGRTQRTRVEDALLALLGEVFAEQTSFELVPERFERALERLDGAAYASACELSYIATLHGLTIRSTELQLAKGLSIAHPDVVSGAPEQALCAPASGQPDHLLLVYNAEHSDPRTALDQGREVMLELLRALRLFGDGRIALGALAWTRYGTAPWEPIALGRGGNPHGMLVVSVEQEDELRAFCNLIARRTPHSNAVAWALRRFELGCERGSEYEGISDHLMALRMLLGGPSKHEPNGLSDGLLAGRLAALCATPEARGALAERTLQAVTLERHIIAGTVQRRTSNTAVARDLANHLRALLRDVICGHLPCDLALLADELLLTGEQVPSDQLEPSQILDVAV